jgi:hypothetical protein
MLVTTPYQQCADHFSEISCKAWDSGNYSVSLKASFSARIFYLADLVSAVVLFHFSLIGLSFGVLQALVLRNTHEASLLNFSYYLNSAKRERIFISFLGGFISPAFAYYFKEREITPMVMGLLVTAALSYIVLKNPPPKIEWGFNK